jgi:hypothetical protein
MTQEELMKCVQLQHDLRIKILNSSKKKRVANTDDRFLSFKRMAAVKKCSVEEAATDLMVKHFIDFVDMSNHSHPDWNNTDYLRELGADIQNYVDITIAIAIEKE